MDKKRGFRIFLYTSLVLLIIALFGVNWGTVTGLVTSFANVALEIQVDLRAPDNLTITIEDQSTGDATLNWSDSNAQGYYIWYSDNVTEILQLNYSNANISELSNVSTPNVTLVGKYNTTWNDTSAGTVQRRFYAVAAYTNDGDIFTTADVKVGKYNLTIYGEDNIGQTLLSTPLSENISVSFVNPPNDFSWMYGINYSVNDTWDYAYSLSENWYGTFNEIEFGYGYLLDDFSNPVHLASAGPIPTGNVTQVIYGEDNIGQTILAWESISTNGNISELITPPNDFSWMYTIDYTQNETWNYAYSLSGDWFGTFNEFEAGTGYLCDDFSSPVNVIYERNPY